jgi:hypothetical protein
MLKHGSANSATDYVGQGEEIAKQLEYNLAKGIVFAAVVLPQAIKQ